MFLEKVTQYEVKVLFCFMSAIITRDCPNICISVYPHYLQTRIRIGKCGSPTDISKNNNLK